MQCRWFILYSRCRDSVQEGGLRNNVRADSIHIAGLGEQSGRVLFSQWDEFCRLRMVVLGHLDTDSIHDLRVASRRMRATLALFSPFVPGTALNNSLKEIRRVTRALGHVRNIDEAVLYFAALPAPLPALAEVLRRARGKEIKAVMKVLKALPCREMDRKLRKMVAELTGGSSPGSIDQRLPAYLSDISIQRYQSLYDQLVPALIPENVAQRHGLRIAIKKWRYLLETLGQVCGKDYGSTLDSLKEYQSVLGRLNDMVEFAALCEGQALPTDETQKIEVALARDTALFLADFMKVAASRPLHYTFLL